MESMYYFEYKKRYHEEDLANALLDKTRMEARDGLFPCLLKNEKGRCQFFCKITNFETVTN
jgi:hypothetical protein